MMNLGKSLVVLAVMVLSGAAFAEMPQPYIWWKMDKVVDGKILNAGTKYRRKMRPDAWAGRCPEDRLRRRERDLLRCVHGSDEEFLGVVLDACAQVPDGRVLDLP